MRVKIRRVHDGYHGWVWRWTLQDSEGKFLGASGWSYSLGKAADEGRVLITQWEVEA
jgi:hypothetical protein